MNHYALLNPTSGLIENIVLWDGATPWEPPGGLIPQEIPVDPETPVIVGMYYIGEQFVNPVTYYSTLEATLGQVVAVLSPADPQPANTTTVAPPPAPAPTVES